MKFNEFAQLLHPIIGGASSTHAFAKTLFDAILTDDGRDILEEVKEETYKAYYNGNTGISRIAKKISPYIEPEEFVDYCNQFPDGATDSLCDSFRAHIPEINSHNVGELLAELFKNIIKEAASTKKKGYSKKAAQAEQALNEKLKKKMLESGAVIAERWSSAVAALVAESETSDGETARPSESSDSSDSTGSVHSEGGEPKVQIINNPTIVNQYGENNIHIDHVDTLKL